MERWSQGQSFVITVFAELAVVHAGGVAADRGFYVRLKCGAPSEVAADAEAHRGELAGGDLGVFREVIERCPRVGVERRNGRALGVLVAPDPADVVVRHHRPGTLEAVINLRRRDDEAVTREPLNRAADRRRELEDFAVEQDAGVFALGLWRGDVNPHRAVVDAQLRIGRDDLHDAPFPSVCLECTTASKSTRRSPRT